MRKLALGLICLLGVCNWTWGAFVGGVERFTGTTLDSNTWFTSTGNMGAFFTQNDALTLHTYEPTSGMAIGAYTTLLPLVPVGGSARVDAIINRANDYPRSGHVQFDLTSDANGVGQISSFDYTLSVAGDLSSAGVFNYTSAGASRGTTATSGVVESGGGNGPDSPQVGKSYTYLIERLTATRVHFAVLEHVEQPGGGPASLVSFYDTVRNFSSLGANNEDLRVQLFAYGADVTFDNVVIAPEPAGLVLLTLIAGLFLRRGRRSS